MNLAVIVEADASPLDSVPLFVGALAVVAASLLALRPMGRLMRALAPIDEESRVAWRLRHVLFLTFFQVVWMVVLPSTVSIPHEGVGLIVLSSLAMLPPCALAMAIAHTRDPARLGALGFRAGHFVRAPLAGLVGYCVAVPGLIALAIAWRWIMARCGLEDAEQAVITALRDLEGGARALAVLLGVVIQPFFEELLFRGFLQPYLVHRLRAVGGICLTSALFASLHGIVAFAPIFALSCLLGYVMMRTQRLHAAWAIHALHNGLQFLFLYVVPEPFENARHAGGLLGQLIR